MTFSALNTAASYATINSPTFTGTPAGPTAASGTNTTQLATTAFVQVNGPIKAWVSFNGTGTPAVIASLNVSSITDLGVGAYVVNFGTALSDALYAAVLTIGDGSGAESNSQVRVRTTTSCTVQVYTDGSTAGFDPAFLFAVFVR